MINALLEPLFRKLEIRDILSSEERQILSDAASSPVSFRAGADLVAEGDRPERSTLVVAGFTTRYRQLADGRRQITGIHMAGDFVDLPSLLLKVMDHSVGALSDCSVVTFPHAALREVTERQPHLARLLWLTTLLDAGILREWVLGMGRLTAPQQLAHFICETYVRLQVAGLAPDRTFSLPLTQTALGDALGLSSVHINRTLQDLRSEGLFTWEGNRIRIIDWERLQRRANFDPLYLHLHAEPR